MPELLTGEVIDTMDLALALRGLMVGAPLVTKVNPEDPTDTGVTLAGTGDGVLYCRPKFGATLDDYRLTVISGGAGGTATDDAVFTETITVTAAGRIIDDDGQGDWTVDHNIVVGDFISLDGTLDNDRNGKLYRVLTIVNNAATNDRMTLETTETLTDETGIAANIKRWHSGVVFNVRRDPTSANVDLGHMTSGRGAVFEDDDDELRLQVRTITNWAVSDTLDWDIEANGILTGADEWADNKTLISTADDDLVYVVETYLDAPSIGGGENINCNILSESNFGADRYNIQMRGADGFVTSSAFGSQPNTSNPVYCAGSANPMVLWATVSGDRVLFMFRAAAGVFEHGYLGLGDVLGDANQHPRPMIIGGSSYDTLVTPGDGSVSHSAWWDAAASSGGGRSDLSSCYHRWVDGQWFSVSCKNSSGSRGGNSDLWWTPRQFNVDYQGGGSNTGTAEDNFYDQTRPAPSTPTDDYQFSPITLVMRLPDENVILEAQGFFFTSGFSADSEDTSTISADEYVFGNNVNATGQGDMGILRLTGP